MDNYLRADLTGSLISMEFGPGGRIVQLWASDPSLPEEGEEFQFILPPLPFGEENAEDLYPGTILIGARTDPDEPWIFARNGAVRSNASEEEFDPFSEASEVTFEYDLPLIPELQATGRFFELAGPFPTVVWEVEIKNTGKKSVEVGELGFPLALNTFYDGFGWSDEQLRKLWNSRLYVHKYIGGAASYVFAQRMTSEPPGLLIFPGDSRGWEFFSSIPSSLSTPHQWEGIPVVYAYSRATIEREGWRGWWNEHTSLILEPGDSRKFELRFVPADRDRNDGVLGILATCNRPAIRLLPGAVAPVDVGIAIEVNGTVPTKWFVSHEAEIQTDADDSGGFCFVRPREAGRLRVSFEDKDGRLSHVHLMFTDPIESLIKRRAQYIVEHQRLSDPESPLHHAFLLTNCVTGAKVTDGDEYAGSSGIECALADALYLAEKNCIFPNRAEIKALDAFVQDFLLDDLQNPGDMSVGSVLGEGWAVGSYAGRPLTYPSVFNLYHALYRIARSYGETQSKPDVYLRRAAATAKAMFTFGWRHYVRTVGILGYARIYDIVDDLNREGLHDLADDLEPHITAKAAELVKMQYPYAGESVLDTGGFEEVFSAALELNDDEHLERTMRCAFAARSLAPSWWWYGSDKRSWDGADSTPLNSLLDRGEACLAHTTIPNALMFFEALDRDYLALPDVYMRLAFGGMLGPWALVRNDGAASMTYCPDLSSKHFGYNAYTGASGLGYFHYLRGVGAYVLPSGDLGTYTFGCHFESADGLYKVRPWDGVGRRVVLRQVGASFELSFGRLIHVELDHRKRHFSVQIENPSDKDVTCRLMVRGMWGSQMTIAGKVWDASDGVIEAVLALPSEQTITVTGKVTG
ncbi:MAG: hypothetical protein IT206_04165 [Fimbriimonadaceae bacterium]|nr:hypothetical protein [Fimbriimonadaceae bacterium]